MVNLTIDGNKISVKDGTTVLRAAQSAGIDIPTLCDHARLTPYGGCRLCVVEVEGNRALQTSCTLPVMENMVIHTDTEKVRSARKFILTMIFSDRNHFCPFCVVNEGDCELQQAAYQQGMTHWPIQPNWKPFDVDASHPYIIQDHNRCILCRRCVRTCAELIGNYTLGVEERGANTMIIADLGIPLGESSCISCGSCVQACPTGSLIDRWSAYRGQEKDMQQKDTICIGCSIGCGVTAMVKDNHLVRIAGNWDAPPTYGVLCKIGRFYPLEDENERIATPMMRKDGKLSPVSWQEAVNEITQRLNPMMDGPQDCSLALISSRLTLESMNLFKEIFDRNLKCGSVTSLDEGKYTTLAYNIVEKLGRSFEARLQDIEKADVLVMLETDVVSDHEVASFLIKRSVPKGLQLIVVDPGENALDYLAAFQVKRDGKSTILNILDALIAALEKESTDDADALANAARRLEHAALLTGVSPEKLVNIAKVLLKAERPLILYPELRESAILPQLAEKVIEFARLSGALLEDWEGLLSLKGKANSYAAAQYGMDKPVNTYGKQVAYIALGDELPSQRLIQMMEGMPYLVVQAAYTSRLTAMADVVLPSTVWGEEEGHYMNVNGFIRKTVKVKETSPDVKSNYEILNLLASKMRIDSRCGRDWRNALKERTALNQIEN